MQITETIVIALITFASGALGTVVGAISTHKASKLAAKNQLQQIAIRETYAARLSAYQEVFEAHASLLSSGDDKSLEKRFITAINRASLVSSPQTVVELALFQDSTLSRSENRVSAVVIAMQKDLAVFTEPEVFENDWIERMTIKRRTKPQEPTAQNQSVSKRATRSK